MNRLSIPLGLLCVTVLGCHGTPRRRSVVGAASSAVGEPELAPGLSLAVPLQVEIMTNVAVC